MEKQGLLQLASAAKTTQQCVVEEAGTVVNITACVPQARNVAVTKSRRRVM